MIWRHGWGVESTPRSTPVNHVNMQKKIHQIGHPRGNQDWLYNVYHISFIRRWHLEAHKSVVRRFDHLSPWVSQVSEAHAMLRFGWIPSIFSTNATSSTSFGESMLMNIKDPWKHANQWCDFNFVLKYIHRIPTLKPQHVYFMCHLRPGPAGLSRNWVGNSSCARTQECRALCYYCDLTLSQEF